MGRVKQFARGSLRDLASRHARQNHDNRRIASVPPTHRDADESHQSETLGVADSPSAHETTPESTNSELSIARTSVDNLSLLEIVEEALEEAVPAAPAEDGHDSDETIDAMDDANSQTPGTATDLVSDDDDMSSGDPPTRNGFVWDPKLNCEARPMSKPSTDTVDEEYVSHKTKCICGHAVGGVCVPLRGHRKHQYKGPNFVFNSQQGAYISEKPNFHTPFKAFQVTQPNGKPKAIYVPVWYTTADYLAGKAIPKLSSERTVPQCAHFPVTGLLDYNVPFVKGRITERKPTLNRANSTIEDQARALCLIEDEEVMKDGKPTGQFRRRMNVHAPPADWQDTQAISCLNRWRAQFRHRKLKVNSREKRAKWTAEALDWMAERLAHHPDIPRSQLALEVSAAFDTERTEHAISCAIDNHKLRQRAEELSRKWEEERVSKMFSNDSDSELSDLTSLDSEDFEETPVPSKLESYAENQQQDDSHSKEQSDSELSDLTSLDSADFEDFEETPVRPKLVPKLRKAESYAKKKQQGVANSKKQDEDVVDTEMSDLEL